MLLDSHVPPYLPTYNTSSLKPPVRSLFNNPPDWQNNLRLIIQRQHKMNSSTPRSSSRTPRRPNGTSTSHGTPGLGQQPTLQRQFAHIMGNIPENEAPQASGVTDFLSGTKTPSKRSSRSRRNGTPSSGRTASRRVATPTQSRSTSKTTAETERRSGDTSYTRTTKENDVSSNNGGFRTSFNNRPPNTPKTKTKNSSAKAKADGRIVRSPTEIVISPAKELYRKVKAANLGSKRQISKAVKEASTQTECWAKEVVFTVHLNKDVTRSLQNRAHGDPKRCVLGTGDLRILKCKKNSEIVYVCQLIGDDGAMKFQADIPESSKAHTHMSLKPGDENSIVWDAYDTSREETFLRSFYFIFDDGADMFATLLHFFGGKDVAIVKEFLKGDAGRFMPAKQTLPPHSIVKNEDDMDVNSDDEEHRPAPLNEEEEAEAYGEVVDESQFLY
eukprot:scaffold2601_cov127-Skeletonema_dohrnii-CCMP3373.AAC.5